MTMNTSEIITIPPLAANAEEFNTGRWVTNDEGAILYSLVTLMQPDNCFECGTANGYSSLWLASALKEGVKVHTFDPVNRPKVWDEASFNVTTDNIVFHCEKFSDGIGGMLVTCNEGSNLFFIDGEHSQGGVILDIESIEPYLAKGDTLVFHDANDRSVIKAYLKLIARLNNPELFFFKTRRGIKVIRIGE